MLNTVCDNKMLAEEKFTQVVWPLDFPVIISGRLLSPDVTAVGSK